MSDEMEKELRELQRRREFWKETHRGKPPSIDARMQSTLDVEEAQIRAKYGQLTPSLEHAVQERMEEELRRSRQVYEQRAKNLGLPLSQFQDETEEEEREIRKSYELPTPIYHPPQPSYTPSVSSPPLPSNSMNPQTWDEEEYEEDEQDSDEWDENEDDEDTDEEEDYGDNPPVFVSSPPSKASAPAYQEQERYQPAQGQSRLGRDIQTGQYVDVPQASRRQGLYLIGIPGTGKTGLIENQIIQDIKQGMGVGLLDPHGDLINAVLARMDRREDDVILLNITDYRYPFGLNLFACSDLTNPIEVQKTVEKVMHIFEKLYEVTRTTPLIIQYLRNCTHTLIANPGYTMADIPLLLRNKECRRKLIANVRDRNVLGFWQDYEDMKPSDQRAEREPILRRLEELLQPLTFNIVGQSTTTINIRQVMDGGKILLVKLDAQLDSITSLIGSILIALFLNAAYSRADLPVHKRRQFNLYADEFQRFATEDFATLLTEARKFGIATTIAHQARFQPGMTDGIRATSLSAKNLVVFKVNSKDGDELAGEFDITPQEAWEEELAPQRVEKIEDEVIDGEEPVQTYKGDVVGHLLKQGHEDERVMRFVKKYLQPIQQRERNPQEILSQLNDQLYEGMLDKESSWRPLSFGGGYPLYCIEPGGGYWSPNYWLSKDTFPFDIPSDIPVFTDEHRSVEIRVFEQLTNEYIQKECGSLSNTEVLRLQNLAYHIDRAFVLESVQASLAEIDRRIRADVRSYLSLTANEYLTHIKSLFSRFPMDEASLFIVVSLFLENRKYKLDDWKVRITDHYETDTDGRSYIVKAQPFPNPKWYGQFLLHYIIGDLKEHIVEELVEPH